MKQRTTIATIVLIFLAVGTTLGITAGKSDGNRQDFCAGKSSYTYMVNIHDGKASDDYVRGKFCDKIMFTNSDKVTREIGFGDHHSHAPYDGFGEKVLNQGQSFTIVLNQTGMFTWHDHLHDEVMGDFNVSI